MSKNIAVSDLAAQLAAAKPAYLADILADEAAKSVAVEKAGANAATRKANIRKALMKAATKVKGASADLAPATKAIRGFLAGAKKVAPIVERAAESGEGLTDDELVLVTKQIIDGKIVAELKDASYDAAKAAVFATMNKVAEEAGEDFPEHTNVEIEVPELGKRLVREGAGRREADLDEDKLRDLVGEDVWEAITSEHVVRVVDTAKLAELTLGNAEMMEKVRQATIPGGWKSPRLMVRDIVPADEKE